MATPVNKNIVSKGLYCLGVHPVILQKVGDYCFKIFLNRKECQKTWKERIKFVTVLR